MQEDKDIYDTGDNFQGGGSDLQGQGFSINEINNRKIIDEK